MNITKFYESYEKLKTVGQGAFGTATLYRRKVDGNQVVIKEVLLMNMDNNEKRSALNEVEILSNLNHPNIIKHFGSFQKEGSLLIVMEYADGGNLAQLINAKKNKNETFTEKSILNIISQTCTALGYMHSHKILHRDLKSANIFLNMNGNVKVGDFGISKMLNTHSQAQTVVGTPYYLSPEMCEGSDYNDKSDIWALGCILYELACLRKPFEAMTLPVLIQKITACQYEDIPESYSDGLSKLVKSILQKSPNLRPSAKYISESAIPKIAEKFNTLLNTTLFALGASRDRSILYKMFDFGDDQKIEPVELPHKVILDFSISATHQVVVTIDHTVYTWGENKSGQLGLGEPLRNRSYATCVKCLQEKNIVRAAAGVGYSIFLNQKGFVYSCGDGKYGCLGHGDWINVSSPKLIEAMKHVCITQIECGEEHVITLTSEGRVFSWGSSRHGQLGQGHTQARCSPLAIKLANLAKVKSIFTGNNESVLLTTNGQIFVSGANNFNKLGVTGKDKVTLFTLVPYFKNVKFVSVGDNHMSLLIENGTVVTIGKNLQNSVKPQTIKLKTKITTIGCGTDFTIAADNKNVLWFWGSSYKNIKNTSNTPKASSILPVFRHVPGETIVIKEEIEENIEYIKTPISILSFYSSVSNVKANNVVYLKNFKVKGSHLFILAHTTCNPPIKQFTSSDINATLVSHIDDTTISPSTMTTLPNTL